MCIHFVRNYMAIIENIIIINSITSQSTIYSVMNLNNEVTFVNLFVSFLYLFTWKIFIKYL